jgi:hypothetical protein
LSSFRFQDVDHALRGVDGDNGSDVWRHQQGQQACAAVDLQDVEAIFAGRLACGL